MPFPIRRDGDTVSLDHNLRGIRSMPKLATLGAAALIAAALPAIAASAQTLDVQRHNYSEWTKGRFTEVVTVAGPGKTILIAGVGDEDENSPDGDMRHLGSAYQQCLYAYDKIKRALAKNGATLADVVKQIVYVTDIRYQAEIGQCRKEMYGEGPIPANTFLVIKSLAHTGMLLEIDVTAVVAK
jgi:2-iminobutanoate/2-iminopropanoate deaminase